MLKLNLRAGDAIVVRGIGLGVLTRQTRAYWYYFFKNAECRVKKRKLWELIDTNGHVTVEYGKNMSRRRKQRKMRILDLHGTSHQEVDEKVRSFLNFVELPCEIVTGHSTKMKEIVSGIVEEYGWEYSEKDHQNVGVYVVKE